jgi:hypothetical protein
MVKRKLATTMNNSPTHPKASRPRLIQERNWIVRRLAEIDRLQQGLAVIRTGRMTTTVQSSQPLVKGPTEPLESLIA